MEAVLLAPITWVVIALAILLVDVFLGFVLLPFVIAAVLVAILAFVDLLGPFGDDVAIFSTWRDVALAYGVASVLGYALLQRSLRRAQRGRRDVNEY